MQWNSKKSVEFVFYFLVKNVFPLIKTCFENYGCDRFVSGVCVLLYLGITRHMAMIMTMVLKNKKKKRLNITVDASKIQLKLFCLYWKKTIFTWFLKFVFCFLSCLIVSSE